MPTRDDILSELGLAPVWRLRGHPGSLRTASVARATPARFRATASRRAGADAKRACVRIADARVARLCRGRRCVHGAAVSSRSARRRCPASATSNAEWLFVGEAPGAEEDAKGEPFVGQAGKLLDNMLAALGMKRGAERLHRQRPQMPAARQPHAGAARSRRVPALSRPADRAAPARRSIVALGKSAADDAARRRRDDRAACAGASTAIAAFRSSSLIIRPTCCATCPTRRRRGKISCSPGARCGAALPTTPRVAGSRIERRRRITLRAVRACVGGPCRPHCGARRLLATPPSVRRNHDSQIRWPHSPSSPTLALAGCGYNDLQRQDEGIKAAWSEVLNQYQRRADLVPNLVNTVKGYAAQEAEGADRGDQRAGERRRASRRRRSSSTIPSRSRSSSRRRASCTGALSRLLRRRRETIRSSSPTRCSATCTAQLEGTENRITVARNRYIKSVQEFNTTVRQFPTNLTAMLFKMDVKPNFTVENEAAISAPPKVDFSKPGRTAPRRRRAPAPPAPGTPATPPAPTPARRAAPQSSARITRR